jgi:hypothetical protein
MRGISPNYMIKDRFSDSEKMLELSWLLDIYIESKIWIFFY